LGPANYRCLAELEFVEAGLSDAGIVQLSRLLTWQAVLCCGIAVEALSISGDKLELRAAEALSAALSWSLCAPGYYASDVSPEGGGGAPAVVPEKGRPVSLQADCEKTKGRLANLKLGRGQIDDRIGRAGDCRVRRPL
jgi:hypothetical protein